MKFGRTIANAPVEVYPFSRFLMPISLLKYPYIAYNIPMIKGISAKKEKWMILDGNCRRHGPLHLTVDH